MDPYDTLNLETETSLLLMDELKQKGHSVYWIEPDVLHLVHDQLIGEVRSVESVSPFRLGRAQEQLLEKFDSLLIRNDPPFDVNYYHLMLLLDYLPPGVIQINRSKALRDLNEKISALKREFELTKSQQEKTGEEIRRLLETAGTNDRDDFRIKLEKNEQAKKLTEARNAALQNIKEITGYQKDQETIAYLKTHDKEDIVSEKSRVEEEIRQLTLTLKAKNKKEGEIQNELEQMENSSELAAYMTKYESLKEELRQATREWLTCKIALKLLDEVKEKYEKEKQPAVLKNSAIYLSKITNGRYTRVTASLDQKEVTIYNSQENAKKIWQLSRGTREQLLISLRLGFIEEYEKQAEPLPLVVDEILVNFDPVRARETAALLSKFALDRQVLLFTCHPGTKDFFDATKVNVINLNK